jgi:hypothetical protein
LTLTIASQEWRTVRGNLPPLGSESTRLPGRKPLFTA